ncbi:hypothetical protein ACFQ07_14840 [Actinomadura adrarensis]|uniref:Uncharacterized protein n=1 Tax=Actinomadura adrarensis TaxID=1819600 RepID=A0ABW3CHN6_9ACTN
MSNFRRPALGQLAPERPAVQYDDYALELCLIDWSRPPSTQPEELSEELQ